MSCSVHDSASLEERGIPVVIAASDQFVSAQKAQAKALGTSPATVWVPHPIQDRTDAEMQELANEAVGKLVEALTA